MIPKLWPYSDDFGGGEGRPLGTPTFLYSPNVAPANQPSIDHLSASITLAGAAKTPTWRFKAPDYNGTNWPVWTYGGTTCSLGGSGDAPLANFRSPFRGANDDSIRFRGGQYLIAADGAVGNSTTQDIVLEFVCNLQGQASGDSWLHWKYAGGIGYLLYTTNRSTAYMYIRDGSTVNILSVNFTPGWGHLMLFLCRSDNNNSSQAFWNGAGGSAGNMSTAGSISNGSGVAFGVHGGNYFDGEIAYAAGYVYASWLDGLTGLAERAALAKSRASLLWGQNQSGSATTKEPATLYNRSTSALCKKKIPSSGYYRYHYMGGSSPRVIDTDDNCVGLLMEPASTDLCTQSNFNATWANVGRTADSTAYNMALGYADGYSVIANTTDMRHGVTIAPTLTAANHVVSVHSSPGVDNYLYMEAANVPAAYAYLNLVTGAFENIGANISQTWVEGPFVGAETNKPAYRGCIKFLGSNIAHTIGFYAAPSNSATNFAGNGTAKSIYLNLPRIEAGQYPTSPTISSGSSVTRAADGSPLWKGDDGAIVAGQGRVKIDCQTMHNISIAPDPVCVVEFADATDTTKDYVRLSCDTAGELGGNIASTGGTNAVITGDLKTLDGDRHIIDATWRTNRVVIRQDNTQVGASFSCNIPDDLDRITYGQGALVVGRVGLVYCTTNIYSE